MRAAEGIQSLVAVLGGLALFLIGMEALTASLQRAAGASIRRLLARAGRGRAAGAGLGAVVGLVAQSSAASALAVGFVQAGLLTLEAAVPLVAGANVGTTLSMQLVSLRLGRHAFALVAAGFFVRIVAPEGRVRQSGQALLGFGLLYLGMNVMADAVAPFRDDLRPWLAVSDAGTLRGMFFGLGVSAAVTLIIQSSGATLGMCFALLSAGAFDGLANVLPIVLGAHLGTCGTAWLASLGTHIEARRTAAAHFAFNLLAVAAAIPLARPLLAAAEALSADPVRQTAHLHTLVALLGAALVLPAPRRFAAALRRLTPSRQTSPPPSFLDPDLLERPADAIAGAVRELQRTARRAAGSLRDLEPLLRQRRDRARERSIRRTEASLDEIKIAMQSFLADLSRRPLARRQALVVQHVDRCMTEIERIGDHVDALGGIAARHRRARGAALTAESLDDLLALHRSAGEVLDAVIASLDVDRSDVHNLAGDVIRAREAHRICSMKTQGEFLRRLQRGEESPLAGLFHHRYVAAFDRIANHAEVIALTQSQPTIWMDSAAAGPV